METLGKRRQKTTLHPLHDVTDVEYYCCLSFPQCFHSRRVYSLFVLLSLPWWTFMSSVKRTQIDKKHLQTVITIITKITSQWGHFSDWRKFGTYMGKNDLPTCRDVTISPQTHSPFSLSLLLHGRSLLYSWSKVSSLGQLWCSEGMQC